MPVFDFQCQACQHQFSELVTASEKISCPQCQSINIKKLFSSFHTISDATRFETGAEDLPSMEDLSRFQKTGRLKQK